MFSLIQIFLINNLLPLSIKIINAYINSTDTKNDDKILEVSKIAVDYLAESSNNTVSKKISDTLKNCTTVQCQKSKL